jgi:hypothetical protein
MQEAAHRPPYCRAVVSRVIRVIAIVTSLLVLISFGLFAADKFGAASRQEQQAIDSSAQLPQPKRHKQPRRLIEGAARVLLEPFAGIVSSKEPWVKRGIPTALGLLIYGFGLGFLSRYARGLP